MTVKLMRREMIAGAAAVAAVGGLGSRSAAATTRTMPTPWRLSWTAGR
jgi:hypothetical protein